jgi:L-asparaginase II
MTFSPYLPVFELRRGERVESIHEGAIAVVDVHGKLLASYGDPAAITYLRSAAKPFQAMPFIERGGHEFFGLTPREVALICASHSGTDEHVAMISNIQAKVGVSEADLLCGTHDPMHIPTRETLRERKEKPTSNRHNCSGKHTGMLAYVQMQRRRNEISLPDLPYIDTHHPIQQQILQTFAEMCDLSPDQVSVGIDGCSAPNFAAPLKNVALSYARLSDPREIESISSARATACRTIASAMMSNPDMVAGPERFDTHLMMVGNGRIVSKAGAEGYQGIGLMPGAFSPDAPGIGIALKIADGDSRGTIRPAVVMEVLRQLGVLTPNDLGALEKFGPTFPIYNWRNILVGEGSPCFQLVFYN